MGDQWGRLTYVRTNREPRVPRRESPVATTGRRLPTILHYGGSGMHQTRNRVHLCPPAARKDRAFPGNPATPADLRAAVDRPSRWSDPAQLRDRRTARLPGLWHLGARSGPTSLSHLPRAVCRGVELQGSRVLSELWRPAHERGRVDSGRPRSARGAHPTIRAHRAFPAEISVGLRRETTGPSLAHLHRHRGGQLPQAPGGTGQFLGFCCAR